MRNSSTPCLFPNTRWSLLERVRGGSPEDVRAALEKLCQAYWYPLYCVARRRGHAETDAKDLVQGFFLSILRRETFATADATIGKLRHLLLRAFENYQAQERARGTRLKRGGGVEHLDISPLIQSETVEERFMKADQAQTTVEVLYTRAWAESVLQRSLAALRADYERRGWQDRFELLSDVLLNHDETASLTERAAKAGVTPGALRVTLHRMRAHYRVSIERELALTLGTEDPKLIREEVEELFKAFA